MTITLPDGRNVTVTSAEGVSTEETLLKVSREFNFPVDSLKLKKSPFDLPQRPMDRPNFLVGNALGESTPAKERDLETAATFAPAAGAAAANLVVPGAGLAARMGLSFAGGTGGAAARSMAGGERDPVKAIMEGTKQGLGESVFEGAAGLVGPAARGIGKFFVSDLSEGGKTAIDFARRNKTALPITSVTEDKLATAIEGVARNTMGGSLVSKMQANKLKSTIEESSNEMIKQLNKKGITIPNNAAVKSAVGDGVSDLSARLTQNVNNLFSISRVNALNSGAKVDITKSKSFANSILNGLEKGEESKLRAMLEKFVTRGDSAFADQLIQFRTDLKIKPSAPGRITKLIGDLRGSINETIQNSTGPEVKDVLNVGDGLVLVRQWLNEKGFLKAAVSDTATGRFSRITDDIFNDGQLNLISLFKNGPIELLTNRDFLKKISRANTPEAKAQFAEKIASAAERIATRRTDVGPEALGALTEKMSPEIMEAMSFRYLRNFIDDAKQSAARTAGEFVLDGNKLALRISENRATLEKTFPPEVIKNLETLAEVSKRSFDFLRPSTDVAGAISKKVAVGGISGVGGILPYTEATGTALTHMLMNPNSAVFKAFTGELAVPGAVRSAGPAGREALRFGLETNEQPQREALPVGN